MHPKAWKVVMLDWNSNPRCLEYDDVGMTLMQIKHPRFLEAYVRELHTQMNDTSKMDEISKKWIDLGGILKAGGE